MYGPYVTRNSISWGGRGVYFFRRLCRSHSPIGLEVVGARLEVPVVHEMAWIVVLKLVKYVRRISPPSGDFSFTAENYFLIPQCFLCRAVPFAPWAVRLTPRTFQPGSGWQL
jgi:hypothetical protein